MKRIIFKAFVFLGIFLTSTVYSAEEAKILTTVIENTISSNARTAGSGNNEAFFMQDWYWIFTLPSDYDIELYAGGTKQIGKGNNIPGSSYDGSFNDSYMQLQKVIYTSDSFKFLLSGRYILPFSENSRDNQQMNWGMQLRPTLIFTLYKSDGFLLTFRTRPTYNEFYYSEDYDSTGTYNIQRAFQLANRLKADFDPFYAYLIANYNTYWNTNGDHIDDKWKLIQGVGWNINKNYYVDLYHESGNRFFEPNSGRRNNIDVFDDSISTYNILFGMSF